VIFEVVETMRKEREWVQEWVDGNRRYDREWISCLNSREGTDHQRESKLNIKHHLYEKFFCLSQTIIQINPILTQRG